MSFPVWDAAIAANATLDELEKLDAGQYPKIFVAKLVAWHMLKRQIDLHSQDAQITEQKRQMKKAARK
jgi:hypothetical protein